MTISNGVTRIGQEAFAICWSLRSVIIPETVTSIGDLAFYNCIVLESVTIPNSVTNMAYGAFLFCNLTNVTIPTGVTSIGYWVFGYCANLNEVIIPVDVTNIVFGAFQGCSNLTYVRFKGNAPSAPFDPNPPYGNDQFAYATNATAYYLPNSTGWGKSFAGLPTAVWQPQIQIDDANFGVKSNVFGFNISWGSGMSIAVDATTSLLNPNWIPLATNTLTTDSLYFSDPQWTNYPSRFYRVRWP